MSKSKKTKLLSTEEVFKTFGNRPFEALGLDMDADPQDFVKQLVQFKDVVSKLIDDQKFFETKDPKALEQIRKSQELGVYVVESMFKKGLSIRKSLSISDDQMESIYYYGKMLYENGRFPQAITLFKQLTIFDPQVARYHFSLAASYHQNQQLDYALASYLTTAILKPTDPFPYYHAADCALSNNDLGSALVFLKSAMQVCGEKAEYEGLKKECSYVYDTYWKVLLEKEKEAPKKATKGAK